MLKLANGAMPVKFVGSRLKDGFEGYVLAKWGNEYVVWYWWQLDHETAATTEHGDYFQSLDNAKERYLKRINLLIVPREQDNESN